MTQFTNPVELTNSNWTDLGAGPLSIAALGPEWPLVSMIVSDQAPSLPAPPGEPLRHRRFFNTSSHVWAITAVSSRTVIVTAPDSGSATAGAGFPASGKAPVTGTFAATG